MSLFLSYISLLDYMFIQIPVWIYLRVKCQCQAQRKIRAAAKHIDPNDLAKMESNPQPKKAPKRAAKGKAKSKAKAKAKSDPPKVDVGEDADLSNEDQQVKQDRDLESFQDGVKALKDNRVKKPNAKSKATSEPSSSAAGMSGGDAVEESGKPANRNLDLELDEARDGDGVPERSTRTKPEKRPAENEEPLNVFC